MTFQAPQPTTSTEILRREPVIFTFTQSGNSLETGRIFAVDRVSSEEQVVATIEASTISKVTGGYSVVGAVDGSNYTYTCKSHTGWVGDTLDIRIDGEYSSTGYTSSATYTLTGDAVTDYVPITDTVSDGLDLLLQQFHESPDFNAWLEAYLSQVAKLSDGVYPTRFSRGIDIATGDRLDWFGQIVNIARGGRTDDDYRLRLRAEMLVLNSGATLDELINILAVLEAFADPDGLIEVFQHNPHTVVFRYIDFLMTEAEAEARVGILDRADPAAVKSWLIHSYLLDNDIFTLSTQGATLETSATLGLGPIYSYGGLYDWESTGYVPVGLQAGEFRFNNADPAKATQIFVHDTDKGPADRDAFMDALTENVLQIELQGTSDRGFYCYVITSTDNGTYHTLDIERPLVVGSNVDYQTNTFKSLATGGGLTGVK